MPPARAVKRGNAHKAVNPFLAFQITVSIFAVYLYRHRFQPRFVAVQHVQQFHLVTSLCCPFRVHAVEHVCPVARLCAARSGMQGDNGIILVIFPVQHGRNVQLLIFLQKGIVHFPDFLIYAVILLLNAHFDECQNILVFRYKPFVPADLCFQCFQLLQCFLAFFQVIPEIRVSGQFFQFGYLLLRASDVKVKPPFPLIFRRTP